MLTRTLDGGVPGDLRSAVRTLRRTPGFTIVAGVMLALAVGANGAAFGLLNAVLRRPPTGVERSASLVWVADTGRFERVPLEYFRALRAEATAAVDLAGAASASIAFASAGEPVRLAAQLVSDNYFSVLRVQPTLGRTFAADEDRVETAGTHPVVVLGHELWRTRFRGDRAVLGSAVLINGQRFDVVGVAPPGFVGTDVESPAALWVPMAIRGVIPAWDARMIGRLRPGVTPTQATAVVRAAAQRLRDDPRFARRGFAPEISVLQGWVRWREIRSLTPVIALGWIITGIVLVVVAANVANLMLVRIVARRQEIGVRSALGASRWRIVRLFAAESAVLALGAGALGTVLAFWAVALVRARFGAMLAHLTVTPDVATITFTLLVALTTGIACSALPAWRASRPDLVELIKGSQPAGLRRGWSQALLVTTQLALSVVLVVTAGLFVRRLAALGDVRPGFDTEHTVALSFDPYAQRYSGDARTAFYDRVRTRVAAMPGVVSVTVPTFVPMRRGALLASAFVPASDLPPAASAARFVVMGVSPAFFSTLRVTLVDGRDFTDRDMSAPTRTAVVSESFARRWWPNDRAVGKRFGIDTTAAQVEIIGVARDIAFGHLGDQPFPHAYVPYTQTPSLPETHVLVRAVGNPLPLVPLLRAELHAIDPTLPVFDVRTLSQAIDDEMAVHRLITRVIGGFGALALVLATLGLYGVVAFTVAGHTREIGIRLALGARPASVVGLFVRSGLRLSLIGIVLGAGLAVGAATLLASVTDGLRPADPVTLAGVAAVLALAVVSASWLSARRAGRLDPMVALRSE